jgi:hypothetical protein
VTARVGETLDVTLAPDDLLVSGTVRTMAAVILTRAAAKLDPGQLEALLRDVDPEPA